MKDKKNNQVSFRIGAIISSIMVFLTIIGFFWTPYDTTKMDSKNKLAGITLAHIMGCDNFGRDIFSRVLEGLGNTFLIAFGTICIGVVAGIIIGAFTGFYGGWLDEVLMRFNDVVFAFPNILLALVFISLFGTGRYNLVFALGIAFVPSFARIVRSEFIKYKDMDFVKSAKLQGVNDFRIMFVHILPNTLGVLVSSIMIGFNNAVLAEAGMSYLGIGIQPPSASLGSMLSEAQGYLFTAPNYAIFPGITIIFLVLGFSLLAEGVKTR